MATVSIVIPVYNRLELLRRCIDSVLTQSVDDFEVLLVDDGSDGNIDSIVETFEDDRIRVYRHDENRGANAARNTGLKNATGDFVLFLDSDDELVEHTLEIVTDCFSSTPQTVKGVFYSSRILKELSNGSTITREFSVEDGEFTLQDYIDSKTPNPIGGFSSVIFSREALESMEPLDEEIQSSQDIDLYIKFLQEYNLYGLDKPLVVKYQHHMEIKEIGTPDVEGPQITIDYRKKIQGSKKIVDRYTEVLSDKAIATKLYAIAWYYFGLEDHTTAREYYRKAFVRSPRTPSHLYYYIFSRGGYYGIILGIKIERLLKGVITRIPLF